MTRVRVVKGTYTKISQGNHLMFADGNIVTSASEEINQLGTDSGVKHGSPNRPADNDEDFNISFSLNKADKTLVPLGILDFENKYENAYFAFNYSLSLSNIETLEFKIKDADGNVIYQITNLEPVVIMATRVPQMRSQLASLIPDYPVKTWDFTKVFKEYSLGPPDYTKVGSYIIFWDGFDNDDVYDSTRFNDEKLTAIITAKKAGKQKSLEVEFSTKQDKVGWVDVRIDRSKKTIDTTLRIDLTDGGAEGISSSADVSKEAIARYNLPPFTSQNVPYSTIESYALQGIERFWSRHAGNLGRGVNIGGELYQVKVKASVDKKGLSAPKIIYQTNTESERSRNWEGSRILFFYEGYLYRSDWKKYPNSIIYATRGWKYETADLDDFKMVAAHEIGHEILLTYGGHVYSKTHKGSSHWSMIIQDPSESATNIPATGEIDLMKYYKNYYDIPRTIITEFDLLKVLWLTKIKIE